MVRWIGWRFEAQGLSLTLIEPQGNRIEMRLGDARCIEGPTTPRG